MSYYAANMIRLLLVLLASLSAFAQTNNAAAQRYAPRMIRNPAPEDEIPPNDTILLHAREAIVHGERLRYEPETNKNCLGFWTNPADWAEWKFQVPRPGVYELEVWQGCGQGNGGSEVRITCASQDFAFVVDETGHFQSFIPRRLGRVHFSVAGEYTLEIRPQNKKSAAVMDIRQIKLDRTGDPSHDIPSLGLLLNGKRTVFLGDSITYSGEYVDTLEALMRDEFALDEYDIINLALPSETLSGLSEPGHANGEFPRPDLHERIDRILAMVKPNVIIACYGMNDGIYHPFSEDRFERFKAGVQRLHQKAKAAGVNHVTFITPPVFDPIPLRGRTLPPGRNSYPQPYEGYNDVLDRYSKWLVEYPRRPTELIRNDPYERWSSLDFRTPLKEHIAKRRETDPSYSATSDGVHLTDEGHQAFAFGIRSGYYRPTSLSEKAAEILPLVREKNRIRRDAWLTHVGHKRPGMNKGLPVDAAEKKAREISGKIATIQDPQLPGSWALQDGFETKSFAVAGKPVTVFLSPSPRGEFVWKANLDENKNEAWRTLSRGYHLIIGDKSVREEFLSSFQTLGFYDVRGNTPQEVRRWSDLSHRERNKPLIRKLGTVDVDLVECNPIVHDGKLLRFEWVREGYWDNKRKTNYFRFRDPATGEVTSDFADGHEFGSAFVNDGTVYVTGTFQRDKVNVFASKDLKTWEQWNAIPGGKYGIFNTSICKAGDEFVLMFEIDKPAEEAGVAFTARFAKSRDLREWRVTPPEMNYAKNRYTAPHALRWHDGWFYNFYLEAHEGYEMRVVRSRDLIGWFPSPLNPVLKASPDDHRIANPQMRNDHRARVANARNINNSDIDFVEHNGRMHITYSWGNQQGIEHLAEAIYDGPETEFLKAWFPE